MRASVFSPLLALTLTGCVATFHLKQIAQEAAAHEAPGRRVVSTVVVCATACEPCDDEL